MLWLGQFISIAVSRSIPLDDLPVTRNNEFPELPIGGIKLKMPLNDAWAPLGRAWALGHRTCIRPQAVERIGFRTQGTKCQLVCLRKLEVWPAIRTPHDVEGEKAHTRNYCRQGGNRAGRSGDAHGFHVIWYAAQRVIKQIWISLHFWVLSRYPCAADNPFPFIRPLVLPPHSAVKRLLTIFSACGYPGARPSIASLRPSVGGISQRCCNAAGCQRNLGSL